MGLVVGEFEESDVKTSGAVTYKTGEEAKAIRNAANCDASTIALSLAFTVKQGVSGTLFVFSLLFFILTLERVILTLLFFVLF